MEKPYSVEAHDHVVLVCGFDYLVIAHASAWLGYDCNAALSCTLDVVSEREECVASDSDIRVFRKPFFLFFAGEHGRLYLEERLPFAFRKDIFVFFADVDIDCVVSVGALDSVNELQAEHFR